MNADPVSRAASGDVESVRDYKKSVTRRVTAGYWFQIFTLARSRAHTVSCDRSDGVRFLKA
jgi:hypothetical protein